MERAITGYHLDPFGDWVAELACGHDQHVRHRPPFQQRAWVLDAMQRDARRGTPLACPMCDRAELPDAVRWVSATAVWDEKTMPEAVRRFHHLVTGTWGRLEVHDGGLHFSATSPAIDAELRRGSVQAIPPAVEHKVEALGEVRFSIEFFVVERAAGQEPVREGGDPACWAGLVCPECGAMTGGGQHRRGCAAVKGAP